MVLSTEYDVYQTKRLSELEALQRQYYLEHRKEIIARSSLWRKSHTERRRQIKMKSRHNIRDGVPRRSALVTKTNLTYYKHRKTLMEFLGDRCIKCGFSDMRALCLDHVNGGGHKEFRQYPGAAFYRYYLKDPELAKRNLQILCANCNSIKRFVNREFAWKHKPTIVYSKTS